MRILAIARSISVAAVCLLLCPYAALAARFIDTGGIWSEKYINRLSDQGVINAETDGKFLPNEPVTRAVFAYWLVKVLGLDAQPVSNKPSFPDVKPSDWCYKPIEIIRQNNYIAGYPDGFRPNQLIPKADLLNIIARTLNAPQPPSDAAINNALATWSDKSKIPLWARAGIAQSTIAGVVLTKTPHLLEPTKIVSRGDAAAILCQLNSYLTHQNVQDSAAQAEATYPTPPQNSAAPTYPMQPNAGPYNGYQGRVSQQNAQSPTGYYQQPPQYPSPPMQAPYQNGAQQPYYPPTVAYVPPPQAAYVPPQSYPMQPGYVQPPPYVPPPPGRVAVVNAGTELHATLKNSLDSSTTQEGEPVEATLAAPFSSGGLVLFPAGSKFVGSVTNVVSAYRTRFTATGKIDIKFTSVETPDGRKFTVDASVDNTKQQLGAAPAAGSTGNGVLGRAAGLTAAFGSGLGSGLDASMRRPAEIRIKAGTSLPVKLNQNLQIATAAAPAMPPPGYVPPAYPPQYGAYPPPQQGYPAPQQQPPYYPQPQQ